MAQTTTSTGTAVFVDGKHKHGGTIYAIHTDKRITLGVVAKMNKLVIESRGTDHSYLVNDWTAPDFIDGERQNTVYYYPTRKLAMAKMMTIAEAACKVTA